MTSDTFDTAAGPEAQAYLQARYEYNIKCFCNMMMSGHYPLGLLKYLSETDFPSFVDVVPFAGIMKQGMGIRWGAAKDRPPLLQLIDETVAEMEQGVFSPALRNRLAQCYKDWRYKAFSGQSVPDAPDAPAP